MYPQLNSTALLHVDEDRLRLVRTNTVLKLRNIGIKMKRRVMKPEFDSYRWDRSDLKSDEEQVHAEILPSKEK